ncbi:MAG: FAD-dependent thymidylate synthase [Paludibacter sp.]
MKLINAGYQILSPINGLEVLKNIERAGRTCYKSENKITDESASEFVRMIIKSGHESVIEHEKITVLFICDRGVSHEIVRHRLASFSQESTRYCNYSKDKFNNELTFISPCWINSDKVLEDESIYLNTLNNAERSYFALLNKGWSPQQARSVLPNSLKTEIVVTANLREWRTIFKQRTSKAAHPQMREIMCSLLDSLKTLLPVIFDDINY